MSYYNTTNLDGNALADAKMMTATQRVVIGMIFERQNAPLSPWQVESLVKRRGYEWPITSIRRTITDLTAMGSLRKTDMKAMGPYGRPECLWRKET